MSLGSYCDIGDPPGELADPISSHPSRAPTLKHIHLVRRAPAPTSGRSVGVSGGRSNPGCRP